MHPVFISEPLFFPFDELLLFLQKTAKRLVQDFNDF